MRIVVLGGGFGGVTAVRHLERVLRRRRDLAITLPAQRLPRPSCRHRRQFTHP